MCGRAVKVSLVVGTILALINHTDVLFGAQPRPYEAIQIGLTYAVPFAVSLFVAWCERR